MNQIHEFLKGMKLYEQDAGFCKRFPFLLLEWQRAFPDISISSQIAWSHAWRMSNPHKKYKRNDRFICNWLASAQERTRLNGGRPQRLPPPPKYEAKEELMQADDWKKIREGLRQTQFGI